MRRGATRSLAVRIATLATALATVCGCGGDDGPTQTLTPTSATRADVIEALFLGSGPAQVGVVGNGCGIAGPGTWYSYGPGETVDVVVSGSVGAEDRPVIEAAVDDWNQAVGGYFTVRTVTTDDPDPVAGPNEITVVEVSAAQQEAECNRPGTACFLCSRNRLPLLDRCRVVVRNDLTFAPGTVHAHEVAHALGLCHLSGRIPTLRDALMASPQGGQSNAFIFEELDAIGHLYASGLAPGATRPDFVAAGLVD